MCLVIKSNQKQLICSVTRAGMFMNLRISRTFILRGRPKVYGDKVNIKNPDMKVFVSEDITSEDKMVTLYSAVVWSVGAAALLYGFWNRRPCNGCGAGVHNLQYERIY